ncbi:MAG: hypothetical protein RL757_2067 [Bacteroidota bacterium]|jgi:hypothetical protein
MDFLTEYSERQRFWWAVGVTTVISIGLLAFGIYVVEIYGLVMFLGTPFFIGASCTILYGYKNPISFSQASRAMWAALSFVLLGLLMLGIEGLICILMSAPIAIACSYAGMMIALIFVEKKSDDMLKTWIILFISIPLMSFFEPKEKNVELLSVVTTVEIDAPPSVVWKNVIEFSELAPPTEWLFKTGIAYPTNARLEGRGVGAVRHCNFTTGSFVEPITTWEEPRLLQFSVLEQPEPMKELSFWDVHAPHLHDYFVSKKGQFQLTELPNGRTQLEGTTWYYHNIKPVFYWRWWSDFIVHSIHNRVLNHIKTQSMGQK